MNKRRLCRKKWYIYGSNVRRRQYSIFFFAQSLQPKTISIDRNTNQMPYRVLLVSSFDIVCHLNSQFVFNTFFCHLCYWYPLQSHAKYISLSVLLLNLSIHTSSFEDVFVFCFFSVSNTHIHLSLIWIVWIE